MWLASSHRNRATISLFQLALRFLGKIKVLLDYLSRVFGKLLHVRIAPAFRFLLKLGTWPVPIPSVRAHGMVKAAPNTDRVCDGHNIYPTLPATTPRDSA